MTPVVVPGKWIVLGVCVLVGAFGTTWGFLGVRRSQRHATASSPAIDAEDMCPLPELDVSETASGVFHRWDPRCKIASLVVFSFIAVSLHRWVPLLFCLGLAVGSAAAARTPVRFAARRLGAMSGFLLMLFFIMPLTVPFHEGDRPLLIDGLSFLTLNLRGLDLAARISTKAVVVALIMEPLLRTSPFSVTLAAVHRLGVPLVLCQMLLLMYRYAFVFRHEVQRMWVGMSVRGFRSRSGWETMASLGSFLGMLFVRSMERTQRVYEAMLCRGYTGAFPTTVRFHAAPRDWAWAGAWITAAAVAFVLDRWSAVLRALPGIP